ncbi:hypothetical protein G6514_001158 [Epicoccum nigrum]|nr:hypothetical protein G6514_001158 [Epicoccum nigrum]
MAATNTKNVTEQVLDLLCGDDDLWTWGGTDAGCYFAFDRGGTGSISCGENQHDFFAIELTWLFAAEPVQLDKKTWRCTMEMAYSTRIARQYRNGNPWLKGEAFEQHLHNLPSPIDAPFPWAPLHSPAFLPKTFTITISRGRYIEPWQHFIKKPYPLFQGEADRFPPRRYASKLTFDVSPYPPRGEWAEGFAAGLEQSLDFHRHWEKKEFVRDGIERGEETWAETLDLGWWLSPTVGEAYGRGMRY